MNTTIKSVATFLALFFYSVSLTTHAKTPTISDPSLGATYFLKLRQVFAGQDAFHGSWVSDPEREALLKTYSEDNPDKFIKLSIEWLKECPVDAKVHLMRASLLLKKGDIQGHFYHRMMYYGLMSSLVMSGDGKIPKTAYQVISTDEEYTLLNHIGAKVKSQKLKDGPYDEMTVEINGLPTIIYFDISIPLSARQRALK